MNWPDDLRRWYTDEGKTMREIGALTGFNPHCIPRLLMDAGIVPRELGEPCAGAPAKSNFGPPTEVRLISAEQFRHMYIDCGLSMPEIGRIIGRHHTTVLYWLRKHGIPLRACSSGASSGFPQPSRERKPQPQLSAEKVQAIAESKRIAAVDKEHRRTHRREQRAKADNLRQRSRAFAECNRIERMMELAARGGARGNV